jgi:hypothetical protein
MVPAVIYILHIILIIYAFLKYKKESLSEGFLAIAFVCIIFAVGWTIATIITNLLFAIDGFEKWYWQNLDSWILLRIRKEFSRDTISLVILTVFEMIFYYYFLGDRKGKQQKQDQKSSDSSTSA